MIAKPREEHEPMNITPEQIQALIDPLFPGLMGLKGH